MEIISKVKEGSGYKCRIKYGRIIQEQYLSECDYEIYRYKNYVRRMFRDKGYDMDFYNVMDLKLDSLLELKYSEGFNGG